MHSLHHHFTSMAVSAAFCFIMTTKKKKHTLQFHVKLYWQYIIRSVKTGNTEYLESIDMSFYVGVCSNNIRNKSIVIMSNYV